jgi:RNA polymerase sigma-70 factor (ECF subfamily)
VDDADVVARLRDRDEDTFRQLVETWTPVMTRVARTHVSTDASAEEVVQDAWLGVLHGIDSFEGRSSLRTWTFRILTNIAKTRGVRDGRSVPLSSLDDGPTVSPDRFRGEGDDYPGHWKTFPVAWPSAEEAADDAATTRQVRQLIDGLPERQRLVIHLRDVLGFTSAEVCELLALSQANQRVLLHRARAAVRAGLELSYAESSIA